MEKNAKNQMREIPRCSGIQTHRAIKGLLQTGMSSYAAACATPTRQDSVSVISGTNTNDRSFFRTQKPQGAFRDEIVVEINTLDGVEFRGTITTKEAIRSIFVDALGFQKETLGSLTIGYSRGRIVTFKLRDQFDIDSLASMEEFNFERTSKNRNGETITSTLGCHIRGIRKTRGQNRPDTAPYMDEGYRWIKIEGAEYRLDRDQISNWLEFWGELASEITEDRVEDENEDSEGGFDIGNGTYSVKMRLGSDLPQFLPMYGKRIRIYYRGIVKKCSNCFGPHARRVCDREKVPWIEYVSQLMHEHPEIPEDFYGKWAPYVHELRTKTGPKTDETTGIIDTSKTTKGTIQDETVHTEQLRVEGDKEINSQTEPKITHSISNVIKPAIVPRVDEATNKKLLKLRGLGLNVSTTPTAELDNILPTNPTTNKVKSVNENSRGRGRRKTSLN